MFDRKSFNLSGFLNRSKQQSSRDSSVIEPHINEDQAKDRLTDSLKQENRNLLAQLQASKQQLQSMKQLLINTKIQHDNQTRGYEQMIQQLKGQLSQKDLLLEKCALTLKLSFNQNQDIHQIQQQPNEQEDQTLQQKKQIQFKQPFDFGDIITELQEVEQIADFTNDQSLALANQQQIQIREERIQNLERQNFELQHQLASKSHKLATIFNAAFQYGGMELLDCLQNSIGLVQAKINSPKS